MLRGTTRVFARATPMLMQQQLPSAFTYNPNKVKDLDPTAAHETLQTMQLTLTRQDEAILKQETVKSVMLNTTSGYLGVNPGHEYKISKLLPGVVKVEIAEGKVKSFFASGGFAHINNNGSIDINCVECIPMEHFDVTVAEKALIDVRERARNGKTETEKAVGEAQESVLDTLVTALKETPQ